MTAPTYDWIETLSPVQMKYLRDNYNDFYVDYKTYGYSVVLYDYSRKIDAIFEDVYSKRIVESVKLPSGLEEQLRVFFEAQMAANDLKYIVVPVENYHIVVLTDDVRIVSELRKSLKDIYVSNQKNIDDNLLKRNCVAVVVDDISNPIAPDVYNALEVNCVPYMRRSIIGWYDAALNVDSENILKKFVNRFRPCKLLR